MWIKCTWVESRIPWYWISVACNELPHTHTVTFQCRHMYRRRSCSGLCPDKHHHRDDVVCVHWRAHGIENSSALSRCLLHVNITVQNLDLLQRVQMGIQKRKIAVSLVSISSQSLNTFTDECIQTKMKKHNKLVLKSMLQHIKQLFNQHGSPLGQI